jgi:hypothetical protein
LIFVKKRWAKIQLQSLRRTMPALAYLIGREGSMHRELYVILTIGYCAGIRRYSFCGEREKENGSGVALCTHFSAYWSQRNKLEEETVHKLLSIGVAVAISFVCIAAAQSMPLAPPEQAQTSLAIPVAGGCGAGFHRNRYGRCVRTAPMAAPGVVVAPRVAPACRRVCNRYGCRRVC